MIPKIIHQTWKNNNIPEKFIPFQQKVKDLHLDWEYKLWTDDDNLEFVKEHFPEFLEKYLSFPKNIMRADVIRYLIMYKMGGVYLDLDYEMIKPFDILEYDLVLPYNRNISFGDGYDAFGNCIFGSVPGYNFWEFAINDLAATNDYENRFKTLRGRPYITKETTLEEAITGPGFLTRIFYSYVDRLKNYTLPEREIFHPIEPRNNKELTLLVTESKSYGIHHCSGTWRDKSLLKRVIRKIKNLYF